VITVVFATFNGSHTLPRMLASLRNLEPVAEGLQIIAVDNGSDDDSVSILNGYVDHLPIKILSQPVRGKNRALNMALSHIQGDLTVFTDDDVIADPAWVRSLVRCAADHPEVDLFGGAIQPHWESSPPGWLSDAIPMGVTYALTDPELTAGPISAHLIWGPNMMVRTALFRAGHRFNEKIGPSSGQYVMGSETEFNSRMHALGHRTYFCPDARVAHIIRPAQLAPSWMIKRGYRYGKNEYIRNLNKPGVGGTPPSVPRWMYRQLAENLMRGYMARFLGHEGNAVKHLWNAEFIKGYIAQAKASRE